LIFDIAHLAAKESCQGRHQQGVLNSAVSTDKYPVFNALWRNRTDVLAERMIPTLATCLSTNLVKE